MMTEQEKKEQELLQKHPISIFQKTDGVYTVRVGRKSIDYKISDHPRFFILDKNTRVYVSGVRTTEDETPKKISVKIEYCEDGYNDVGLPANNENTVSARHIKPLADIQPNATITLRYSPVEGTIGPFPNLSQ